MSKTNSGQWSVRYSGPDTSAVEVTAVSREQALEKMRSELRYRLELCPCTGEQYKDLEIELVEER
jgi:hypothetical protein